VAKKKQAEERNVQIVIFGIMPSGERVDIISAGQNIILPFSEADTVRKYITATLTKGENIGFSFDVDDREIEKLSVFISSSITSVTIGIMKI